MSTPSPASSGMLTECDAKLLESVLSGQLDAYEGIMRHHNQRLFRLARSIVRNDAEAMDVVQESFVLAFEHLHDLDDRKAFPVWIGRIVKNSSLMRLRKNQRYTHMDESQLENVLHLTTPVKKQRQPDQELANQQLAKLLEECIDELPTAFRAAFVLRQIEECSTRDTALIQDIPEATVKTRFHRAKLMLRKRMVQFSKTAGVAVYEFAGQRCDTIVSNVMQELRSRQSSQ